MRGIFLKEIGIAPVRSNPAGRKTTGRFAPAHEYALFYGKSEDSIPGSLSKTKGSLARFPKEDNKGRYAWANFIRSGTGDKREDRPTMYYPIYVHKNNALRIPKMDWDDKAQEYVILEQPSSEEEIVYPMTKGAVVKIEKRWHRGYDRVIEEPEEFRVRRDSV